MYLEKKKNKPKETSNYSMILFKITTKMIVSFEEENKIYI